MATDYTSSAGMNGTKVTAVAGDYLITVGCDANVLPSVAVDPTGAHVDKTVGTASGGLTQISSAMTKYRGIDTAPYHMTGNFSIFAGNKFAVSACSGGIELDTTGVVTINSGGGMINLISGGTVDMMAQTMQMTSSEAMRFAAAEDIHLDSKSTNMTGNISLGKNLKLQGSLAVQGELYSTHMTAQKQVMETDDAGASTGYLNPFQSYALLQGNSTLAKAFNGELLPFGGDDSKVPIPGYIPVNLIFDIPGIPGMDTPLAFKFAAQLQFPKGVLIVSNAAVDADKEATIELIAASMAGIDVPSVGMGDFNGPAHSHQYYIPACTLVDSTDEVWNAAQACDREEAAGASPMQPFGTDMAKFMKQSFKKAAKRQADSCGAIQRIKKAFGFGGK